MTGKPASLVGVALVLSAAVALGASVEHWRMGLVVEVKHEVAATPQLIAALRITESLTTTNQICMNTLIAWRKQIEDLPSCSPALVELDRPKRSRHNRYVARLVD